MMKNIDQIRQKISCLKHGESFIWSESDYGLAEIWKLNDVLVLFSIPMYGGEPNYERVYECKGDYVNSLISNVQSWT